MSKKKFQYLAEEIAAIKACHKRIDKNVDQYVDELKKINEKLDRIEAKFDVIIKWSKFGHQLWERN